MRTGTVRPEPHRRGSRRRRSRATRSGTGAGHRPGALVGAALALDAPGTDEGYVEQLAVRRDHRGRGIARLLLRHTFRAFHRTGVHSCTLWTHSDTGALGLYLRAGMTVRQSSTVFCKELEG
nr:GNAT family N-acetyltransferase [Streptomyces longwoodensis]